MNKRDRDRLSILHQMRKSVPRLPGLKIITKNQKLNHPSIKLYLKWDEHELLYLAYPSYSVISVFPIGETEYYRESILPNPKIAMKRICTNALIQHLTMHQEDPKLLARVIRYRRKIMSSSLTGMRIARLIYNLWFTERGLTYRNTSKILSIHTGLDGDKLLKICNNNKAVNSILSIREITKEEWNEALNAKDFCQYMRKFRDPNRIYEI